MQVNENPSRQQRTRSTPHGYDEPISPRPVPASLPPRRTIHPSRSVPTITVEESNWGHRSITSLSDGSHFANALHQAYYRLYWKPSAALPSLFPVHPFDPSLASFYLEHIPPPRKAKNYIAFICAREKIHVSRIQLYVSERSTRTGEERLRPVNGEEALKRGPTDCGSTPANPLLITVEMPASFKGQRARGDAVQSLPLILRTSRSFGNLLRKRKTELGAEPPLPASFPSARQQTPRPVQNGFDLTS